MNSGPYDYELECIALRARVAEVEADRDDQIKLLLGHAARADNAERERDAAQRMQELLEASPYLQVPSSETAVLRARVAVLEAALLECSQSLDGKGESCWCCLPGMIPYRGHDAGCEAARAALSPDTDDGEREGGHG